MTDAMTTGNVLDFSLGPNLTAEEAEAIYARGKEAVIFALLELAAQLRRSQGQCASVSSPATPSGHEAHSSEAQYAQTPQKTGAQGGPRRTCVGRRRKSFTNTRSIARRAARIVRDR